MNQSHSRRHISSTLFLAIASICAMSTGCSTMTSITGNALPVEPAAVSSPNGSYTVEMHSNFGAPKQYKGTLDGSTTVSDALTNAGAIKKHRAMDVEILRVVEHQGKSRGLRMPVNYETRLGGPKPEQDYALLDGDRVVVKPKESSSIVKMISTVAGMGR
ncbi:hypothetical protein [Mariniblastus fucicola]|nr:hypothetical protein [Mariniblastus fucicola]